MGRAIFLAMGLVPVHLTRLRRQDTAPTGSTTGTDGSASSTDSTNPTASSTPPSSSSPSSDPASSSSPTTVSFGTASTGSSTDSPPSSSVSNDSSSSAPSPSSSDVSSTQASSSSSAGSTSSFTAQSSTSFTSSTTDSSSSPSPSSAVSSSSSPSSASSSSASPSSVSSSLSSSSPLPSSTSPSTSSTASSSTSLTSISTSSSTTPISSSSTSNTDSSSSTPSSTTNESTSSQSGTLTTITSSLVTTIDGQRTTIVTSFPTTLNSSPSNSTSGKRNGVIAGSAIAGTLLVLALLAGIFVFHRRRARRKIEFAHRALPAPRSALLADEDGFDLAGESTPDTSHPQLLRPRGMGTGSIFHEGVWPPPGEPSRLEDPLLSGSSVDLTSIVDDVMGGRHERHGRGSSGDTSGSSVPLLGNVLQDDRPSGSPPSAFAKSMQATRSPLSAGSDPAETMPLNPFRHPNQQITGNSRSVSYFPNTSGPVRGKSGRSAVSVSTTGSPHSDATHLRGGVPSGIGSLVVVNNTPDIEQEAEYPLVDLTPGHDEPPKEIPPLYHMIRRDTADTFNSPPSSYSQPPQDRPTTTAEENTLRRPGSIGHVS
ncbi:hypothetical protein K439DRAFT_1080331 [Ramaria rubella]|nr:hypothetical protein K439DRAFT_1080331 [Ramaria rubella]